MDDIVLNSVEIFSSTKDSISVKWNTRDEIATGSVLQGFEVHYQAFGSLVKQHSDLLQPSAHIYDITQLHENTHYNVCVRVITSVTSQGGGPGHVLTCVTGTTAINSLSVALGSTLGAFLALGVIVMFVLIAKWQHFRRNRKMLQHVRLLSRDSMVGLPLNSATGERIAMMGNGVRNGYIELNSLRNVGAADTQEKDDISQTSDYSGDIILHPAGVSLQGSIGAGAEFCLDEESSKLVQDCGLESFIIASPSNSVDGCACAGGGKTYSLLLPLSAMGVLPFLMHGNAGGQTLIGGGYNEKDLKELSQQAAVSGERSSRAHGSEEDRSKVNGHSVVRLKLRKHPTIDYGGGTQDEMSEMSGEKGESKLQGVGGMKLLETEPRTENCHIKIPHEETLWCAHTARTGMVRSLSNNW